MANKFCVERLVVDGVGFPSSAGSQLVIMVFGHADQASFVLFRFKMNTPANPTYKILVVDDDLELNTSFALLLEFDGHEVQTAYTAEAALEKLSKGHFDLMISEYWLPRMRGDQLAALVKQRSPDLPIIMVTANFEEVNMEGPPIAGVNCLLDKPFTMNQLREAMNWVLSRHEPEPAPESASRWGHADQRAESPDSPSSLIHRDDIRHKR